VTAAGARRSGAATPASAAPRRASDAPVRVLARGLAILRAFVPRNEWLANHEIAERCGLPRPTVSRLATRLVELGCLTHSTARGRYRLAAGVFDLGYAAAAEHDFVAWAHPRLQQLAREEDALVVLATRDELGMACLDACYGERSLLALRVSVGSRLSLVNSALGRALIGAMASRERQPLLEAIAQRMPDAWPSLGAAFEEAAEQMRRRRFYLNLGELEQGVHGVATVVDAPDAPHRFSVGAAAPAFRFSAALMRERIGPRLLELRRDFEAALAAMRGDGA
jgi:DNA-binding IclR family transcriptional regulator